MSNQIELMKIAKDLTVTVVGSKNFKPDDLRDNKVAQTIKVFKEMLDSLKKEAESSK